MMVPYIFHYSINDNVEDSPRYEHTIFLNVLLKCRHTLEVCGITKEREVERILDCDELCDVKTLRVLVSDQAPLQDPDDRVLEELDGDPAGHQTVDCQVVAVRQADLPHLAVRGGDGERNYLETRVGNTGADDTTLHYNTYLYVQGD